MAFNLTQFEQSAGTTDNTHTENPAYNTSGAVGQVSTSPQELENQYFTGAAGSSTTGEKTISQMTTPTVASFNYSLLIVVLLVVVIMIGVIINARLSKLVRRSAR